MEEGYSFRRTIARKKKLKESDFKILNPIGTGYFSTVYLVERKNKKGVNEFFAMKKMEKQHVVETSKVAKILLEKELLSVLHYPFIVHLHFAFQSATHLYLIFDFVNGGDLFFHLAKNDFFDEKRAKFYAAEVFLALYYLHEHKIMYRDLKPENILMGCDGHLKLADLGLAKKLGNTNETTNTVAGTPIYLAPEILTNIDDACELEKGYNMSVDWWSYGILVFELLFGKHPFIDNEYDEDGNDVAAVNIKEEIQKRSDDDDDDDELDEDLIESEREDSSASFEGDVGEVFSRVSKKEKLQFPSNRCFKKVSIEARDFVTDLLEYDPTKRLGASDANEIKNHPWFKDIDFAKLEKKEIKPPFVPRLRGPDDLKYFDLDEVAEDIAKDNDNNKKTLKKYRHRFKGYSWCDVEGEGTTKNNSTRVKKSEKKVDFLHQEKKNERKSKWKRKVTPIPEKELFIGKKTKKKVVKKIKNPRRIKLKKI